MKRRSDSRRLSLRALFAVMLSVLALFVTMTSARAADFQAPTVKVGSSTTTGSTATWTIHGEKYAARVVANFTGHTTNSVVLKDFKVCMASNSTFLVSAHVKVAGKYVWSSGAASRLAGGTCRTYNPTDRRYTKSSTSVGNLFWFEVRAGTSYASVFPYNR